MSEQELENLSGIDLLSDLDSGDLKKIEEACSFKRFADQEQVIDRQSESTDVYFVISGDVRVVNYSLSGREIALDDMAAGAYFGELAALDGEPRSASVMALSDCLIAAMPQEQFLPLLESILPLR